MMRRFLFIIILLLNNSIFSKGLQDPRWVAITADISKEGDPKDKGEFEAAVQALKNIEDEIQAEDAAGDIEGKWGEDPKKPGSGKNKKGELIDPEIAKEATSAYLLQLKRYPTMDAQDVKRETKALFEKPSIDAFLKAEGIKVTLP